MGSYQSSGRYIYDIGEDEVKKKMILYNHRNCILKAKLKEIKNKYGIKDEDSAVFIINKLSEKEINYEDKWFINIIKNNQSEHLQKWFNHFINNFTREEMSAKYIIAYIITNNNQLVNFSEYLDDEYNNIPSSEINNMLSKFHLYVCRWFYQRVGSHRILQLNFDCKECGASKTIEMDKTTNGKNIYYANNDYDPPQWWHWRKWPKYTYDFNDILRYYRNASNHYNSLTNNCCHFAHEIYDNIQGKQTY